MLDPETIVEKLKLVEQEMDVYRWYREAGLGEAVRDAIELIERAAKPIDRDSEEGFAVRTLRTAAERGDYILVESENASYMAKPHSDAVLATLKHVTLSTKEAANE